VTDANSHAIALHSVQTNPQQDVAYILKTVVEPEHEHRDSAHAR
jgi:hypothetical protein